MTSLEPSGKRDVACLVSKQRQTAIHSPWLSSSMALRMSPSGSSLAPCLAFLGLSNLSRYEFMPSFEQPGIRTECQNRVFLENY